MIVIPAVDIKNGKCVRLEQGRMDAETVFSDDPAAMAARWVEEGATLIHLVDLDGAVAKTPRNLPAVRRILRRVAVPVQLGGGVRDLETIRRYMDEGVQKIVIGTEAVRNPRLVDEACRLFPGCIVVGIDARHGMVAIEGWTEVTQTPAAELASRFESSGVAAINFTDIARDGMETGPNIEATRQIAEAVAIPVVASGGVSGLEDIRRLRQLEPWGVVGVITGKALYTGRLSLREALAVAAGQA